MPTTAKATINKLTTHLWYLSEKLVGLAFFDPNVTTETKRKMVLNLDRELPEQENENRFTLHEHVNIEELQLEYFVSKRTHKFFEITGIKNEFLLHDPSEWHNDLNYTLMVNELLPISRWSTMPQNAPLLYINIVNHMQRPIVGRIEFYKLSKNTVKNSHRRRKLSSFRS